MLVPVAIGYVLWYGNRVRNDGTRSLLPPEPAGTVDADVDEVPELTRSQKWVLVVFGLAFATLIYGFIPWDDVWDNLFDAEFSLWTFSNFYFTEASMLFIVGAVVVGLIARFGEERIVNTIVEGAADFLGAALVIVAARGITVVMKNTYITDTVLHWMEEAVSDSSNIAFALLAYIINIPDRVPGAVVVRTRRARHADPRAAVGLRRRRTLDLGDRVPVGVGVRELPHADGRGRDGRPDARQGGLQPVPALPCCRSSPSCSCSTACSSPSPRSWTDARRANDAPRIVDRSNG